MFADLRAELMEEVDDVWSERLRHLPLRSGLKDETRDVSEFIAVSRTGDHDAQTPIFGRGKSARSAINAAGGYLRINKSEHPDLVIRKGDKVVALEREGEPAFEILSVDDRSHLRLICELGDA